MLTPALIMMQHPQIRRSAFYQSPTLTEVYVRFLVVLMRYFVFLSCSQCY